MNHSRILLYLILLFCSLSCLAEEVNTTAQGPIEERIKKEEQIPANYFSITLYKPTYILPYYYTFSPYNSIYQNNTPNNEKLKNEEFKYQLSFKVPVWQDIFDHPSSLFLAYSQLSYWQVYNNKAFFRETDYEPELFLANELKWHLSPNWRLSFLNVGVSHQSNGYGNTLERSWNRLYVDAIISTDNWMISIKPWYILSTYENNENIGHFLGYGNLLVSYKLHQQVFSLRMYNVIESAGKRGGAELSWSFPITPYIKGYLQAFSGYGQSLIEYNHRTNSLGIGIALNDWV